MTDIERKIIKGRITILEKNEDGEYKEEKQFHNLMVDDGLELILDFLVGRKSWWNPKAKEEYSGGDSGWDTTRYMAAGECMFNNSSEERADGQNGIPTGTESDYPVSDYLLVSPEDSTLSREVGTRTVAEFGRNDQKAEVTAEFESPGDIPTGTKIREYGLFLGSSGPEHDPSVHDDSKPEAMFARGVRYGTGEYGTGGSSTWNCYEDDAYTVTADFKVQWEIGEF